MDDAFGLYDVCTDSEEEETAIRYFTKVATSYPHPPSKY